MRCSEAAGALAELAAGAASEQVHAAIDQCETVAERLKHLAVKHG
ncbi:hypothetical protein [Nannocystis punicea]|uniref:Uncharacterized protein n=1 Tax=Nannocystis punicea TaxID=2995304 RepID=A0ABY7GSP3_9BACT|nr:hypothetical protein [Nannocystis poenicansa]WAS89981.1 hypothetical protein O0S08_27625 [Nannocystis poenicansa]